MEGGGAKSSLIQIFDLRKVGLHLEIFGQPKRRNINHRSHTISVIMTPGSEEAPITNFEKNQSIGMPSVNQQRDLQVNSDDSLLV